MKKTLILIFVVIGISNPVYGFELDYKANFDSKTYCFVNLDKSKSTITEMMFEPSITLVQDKYLLYLEADFRFDNIDMADGIIWDDSRRRKNVDLGEFYFEYLKGKMFSRLGYQEFDFSILEKVSASDMINPRDWNHIIDYEKVTVPALNLKYGYSDFVELVYVPWFMPSRLPGDENPWSRIFPSSVDLLAQEMPDRNDGQFLLRLGTTLFDTDYIFSYYNGYSYSPGYRTEFFSPESLAIVPWYNKQELFAFSVSRMIGEYTLNTEIAYFDQDSRDNFIQFGLSVSRLWSGFISDTDSLYVMLQYSDETVVDREEGLQDDYDLRRMLQGIQSEITYILDESEEWALKLQGAVNTSDGDYYFSPSFEYNGEKYSIQVGVAIFSGESGTFFGEYSDNDYGFIKLKFSF